nr:MAG TPA: hypothetical protein [Inoviridae sp.]
MKKERYERFGKYKIKENGENVNCRLFDTYETCIILNRQDKEIEELKEKYNKLYECYKKQSQKDLKTIYKYVNENQQLKQSQNQKTIEELEKLKLSILDFSNGYWHYFNKTGDAYITSEDLESCLKEFIDNQIK